MPNSAITQKKLSTIAQALYVANLLILPGLAFLFLLVYFIKFKSRFGLARIHLYRSMQLCALNGIALAVIPIVYIFLAGNNINASIMIMLFYFICMHAIFVLLGMLNLSRAMAKKLPLF
ncbi:hypothetical protein KO527_14175 [Pseudoalteromonas sp. C2R02]|uniref:hypothetical protein n=1 Tax=Pseudoalteromonas sp. C2R02 TaxID=2841565 RepID=UPI001C0953C7|nr:hypothetical protein [Pseudoalteromonas sp. C2R02]MBU2970497.1 hypothetical protein [Pseudoalteromonas sp. C2R02]